MVAGRPNKPGVWGEDAVFMLQAIKDAEADEKIADQLAALHRTLSQLAKHEAAAGEEEGQSNESGRVQTDGQHFRSSAVKVHCSWY